MAGKGGKRIGAGRKPNALKEFGFDAIAAAFPIHKQQAFWESKLNSGDERISLDAGKYLTDRMFGKAAQAVKISGDDEHPVSLRVEIIHVGGK